MTTPLQMKWFRVEQSTDGSILSCTEVDAKGRKGAHVRYYEATDSAAACAFAKEWFARRKAGALRSVNARHARLIAQGLCTSCGHKPLVNKRHCKDCRQRARDRSRELYAGAAPRQNNLTPAQRLLAEQQRSKDCVARMFAEWGSRDAYAQFLLLRRLDELGPKGFRAMLVSRITKNGGAIAEASLAKYEAGRRPARGRAA